RGPAMDRGRRPPGLSLGLVPSRRYRSALVGRAVAEQGIAVGPVVHCADRLGDSGGGGSWSLDPPPPGLNGRRKRPADAVVASEGQAIRIAERTRCNGS